MTERPLILVTNDDGAGAKGLKALLEVVRPLGIVYAVVPAEPHSGMSHAITVTRPVQVNYRKDLSGGDYHCYTVTGTPVDCVKLAINRLLPGRPDLLVSGINHGSNASVNLIYSGTMGAALEGAVNGIRSIGLSLLDYDPEADFSVAADLSGKIIRQVLTNGYHPGLCLNVNIPVPENGQVKGIRVCRQTKGYWSEEFEEVTEKNGEKGYLLRGTYHNLEPGAEGTDQWALEQGYAAVVPVDADHTRYPDLEILQDLNTDLSEN
jgi:5'-nucleotidase